MSFAHSASLTIGVDLGATNLRIAAFSPESGIVQSVALPTRVAAGPMAVVDDICDGIRRLLDSISGYPDPIGVGVGSPGPLELPAGRLHDPPNLPGWNGFDLRIELERRLQVPVLVEGDANAAALAEFMLGSGKALQVDSLCMLTLGTGVGSGIILDGNIFHGATGMAAEAGHLTVDPNGPLCGCGNTGCLEACASATALVNAARRLVAAGTASNLCRDGLESLTAGELAQAAHHGDPSAIEIFAQAGRALGIALAGLINMLNLPLYVIGGGVAQSWDLLAPSLFRELDRCSYVFRLTKPGGRASQSMPGGGTQVIPATLGAEAGLLGASLLPLQPAARSV
jgi:glucokinase